MRISKSRLTLPYRLANLLHQPGDGLVVSINLHHEIHQLLLLEAPQQQNRLLHRALALGNPLSHLPVDAFAVLPNSGLDDEGGVIGADGADADIRFIAGLAFNVEIIVDYEQRNLPSASKAAGNQRKQRDHEPFPSHVMR